MNISIHPYVGHRYPAEIISHAVWLYFRFTLSICDIESYWLHTPLSSPINCGGFAMERHREPGAADGLVWMALEGKQAISWFSEYLRSDHATLLIFNPLSLTQVYHLYT
jgi:hypothetical protein